MKTPRHRVATRYWHASPVPGVSCLEASFTSQHFSPHAHDALVIAVTEAGGSAYASRGRRAEADPSVLLVFNPTEPHAGHMRGSTYWRYRALYLAEPAVVALLEALGRTTLPGFTNNGVADPELIAAFRATHRELDEEGDPNLARERLIDACGRLFNRHGATSASRAAHRRDRTIVDSTLAAIHRRFRDRLTVDDLAAAAGLSPFQLIRQFKRVTGMPPHAHLIRARLDAALRLLQHDVSLADAALASGFYDQSALTHAFKRTFGITPGQYVEAHRRHPQISPRL